jgi:hypothetical protein
MLNPRFSWFLGDLNGRRLAVFQIAHKRGSKTGCRHASISPREYLSYMLLLRLLGAVASVDLAAGRIPARVYRKVWGRAPLHWFDHRFDILRGLAKALSHRRNLRFYKADVAQDNFPDTKYDTILCFSALQQMSRAQLDTLLPKINLALRPNSYFCTTPQAIRSPELPEGSVFMSSAFAWITIAVPPLLKSE